MTTRTKKLFSILLLVCMIISMVPAVASAATPSKVYLKPNSNWTQASARFAAYFWNSSGDTWVSATAMGDGYYEVSVPSGYTNIIFCRMNPSTTANNWDNKWNQSSDLTVPTNGTNCYNVAEGTWDKGGGSWSTYVVEPEETEPVVSDPVVSNSDYYLFGYINGANYGCEEDYENLGDYKFVNGTVTATFSVASYVAVKTGDNASWYMTDGWLGTSLTSCTLYNTETLDDTANKLYVPAGTYTFTLVQNSDGTLTLSYASSGSTDTTEPSTPDETTPTTPTTPGTPADGDYYLVGSINDTNVGSDGTSPYKFVNGTLTATFSVASYVCVMDSNNVWYMTDGWLGQGITSATLYNTANLGTDANKVYVPANVEVTFTLTENADGSLTLSYTKGAATGDYYLFGYINGEDYGTGDDYATLGEYKFVNGKLTCTFPGDSYVGVKSGDNMNWYMTKGWYGNVTSGILYDTAVYADFQNQGYTFDKLAVPGGVELTFTLVVNTNDDTVTLSYERSGDIGYQDESGIQDGLTLHAWNWSFNAIKENMALIASQGYTAVQTSPIQPVKESTTGKDMHGVWWVQYQPVDFIINTATDNPLGTASEFAAMCAEAEKYGVQVIVDVVANHMANHMSDNTLSLMIPEYIRLDTTAWHDYTQNTSAEHYENGDRYGITQYCMGGVPDLNTGSDKVQGYVLNFLKECIDAGADGFRFDGAKHIETPDDDATFASDFWPTVIGGAEDYAESLGRKIYVYGEVLDSPGLLSLTAYTKYMSVTDNSWGRTLLHEINGSGTANQNLNGYNKSADKTQIVTWAECHDDYSTSEGHCTENVSVSNINKTWALVAARDGIMGLYFARPSDFYSTTMGTASLNTGWDFAEVKAVNLFHNAFVGQTELAGNSGNIAYVVRGTTGIVLVNASGTSSSVSISGTGMANGTYKDQVSGNTFTVSGGKITGSIGSTGIAVVYNASTTHTHSYTAVVTAPTCTAAGYTTYTCSCGDSYTGNTVAATGHNYVNGTCTNCGAKDSNEGEPDIIPPTVTAKSFSLSFEDEILVNFYYTISDETEVTEHGMLVFYSNPGTADYSKADVIYSDATYDSLKARYGITTTGIAAKEMGDTRYYVGYAKLSDGTYSYSTMYDYSPKKYAMNMLGKDTTSDAQKKLCVAMLNYGAAAQNYFTYNTDSLMNAELTADQKALVIAYDASLFTGAVAATATKSANFTATSTGFSKKTATVSFEGAFCVNYYFTPSATVSGNMTLYYWTPEDYASVSTMTTANATGSMTMVKGDDGRYWGQVSGIPAKTLDDTYYVAAVYYNGSTRYCTGVVAYSLSKYCMNNASGDMGELAQATAMYGYYAKLYFTA